MFYNYGHSTDQICLNRKIKNRHYIFTVGGDLIDWHIELTGTWRHDQDSRNYIVYRLQSSGTKITGEQQLFFPLTGYPEARRHPIGKVWGTSNRDHFFLENECVRIDFELSSCGTYFTSSKGDRHDLV